MSRRAVIGTGAVITVAAMVVAVWWWTYPEQPTTGRDRQLRAVARLS